MLQTTLSLPRAPAQAAPCSALAEPADALCEIFHENSRYTRAGYARQSRRIVRHLTSRDAIEAASRNFKVFRFAPHLELPPPAALQLPLSQALHRRVSTRVFSGAPLSLASLAAVLVPAAACTRSAVPEGFPDITLRFRAYPSGGAEYPVEIYPILLRVSDATPQVTHFDPVNRALSVLGGNTAAGAVTGCLMHGGAAVQTASAVFVLTATFERSTDKYGDRGYRFALLEAGHVAQNLCLTAAAAGLGTLAWGGFYDDELNALIGVDGVNEAAVHCLLLGGVAP